MAVFHCPVAIARAPGESRALWRRLFMQALSCAEPSNDEISNACYAASLLSGAPLIRVVDGLVELGLRAPLEAFPKPWVALLRSRVLDMGERELMPYGQQALAASWGWMPVPTARISIPSEIDPELDPYGADLAAIFLGDLGTQPRFGYTPAQVRLALLRTAVGVGRPLAEVVTALIMRGMTLPAEAIPAGCRETLRTTSEEPLVKELVASWHATRHAQAEIIQLRHARQ